MKSTLLITACLILLVGCESSNSQRTAQVQGSVTIDGELTNRGSVTFHPLDSGPIASGKIDNNGTYALQTGQGNLQNPNAGNLFPGEYVATVVVLGPSPEGEVTGEGGPPLAGPRLTAQKYANVETSGLRYKVKAGKNVFDIKTEGAWADPPLVEEEPLAEDGAAEDGDTQSQPADESPSPETEESATQETLQEQSEPSDEQEAQE